MEAPTPLTGPREVIERGDRSPSNLGYRDLLSFVCHKLKVAGYSAERRRATLYYFRLVSGLTLVAEATRAAERGRQMRVDEAEQVRLRTVHDLLAQMFYQQSSLRRMVTPRDGETLGELHERIERDTNARVPGPEEHGDLVYSRLLTGAGDEEEFAAADAYLYRMGVTVARQLMFLARESAARRWTWLLRHEAHAVDTPCSSTAVSPLSSDLTSPVLGGAIAVDAEGLPEVTETALYWWQLSPPLFYSPASRIERPTGGVGEEEEEEEELLNRVDAEWLLINRFEVAGETLPLPTWCTLFYPELRPWLSDGVLGASDAECVVEPYDAPGADRLLPLLERHVRGLAGAAVAAAPTAGGPPSPRRPLSAPTPAQVNLPQVGEVRREQLIQQCSVCYGIAVPSELRQFLDGKLLADLSAIYRLTDGQQDALAGLLLPDRSENAHELREFLVRDRDAHHRKLEQGRMGAPESAGEEDEAYGRELRTQVETGRGQTMSDALAIFGDRYGPHLVRAVLRAWADDPQPETFFEDTSGEPATLVQALTRPSKEALADNPAARADITREAMLALQDVFAPDDRTVVHGTVNDWADSLDASFGRRFYFESHTGQQELANAQCNYCMRMYATVLEQDNFVGDAASGGIVFYPLIRTPRLPRPVELAGPFRAPASPALLPPPYTSPVTRTPVSHLRPVPSPRRARRGETLVEPYALGVGTAEVGRGRVPHWSDLDLGPHAVPRNALAYYRTEVETVPGLTMPVSLGLCLVRAYDAEQVFYEGYPYSISTIGRYPVRVVVTPLLPYFGPDVVWSLGVDCLYPVDRAVPTADQVIATHESPQPLERPLDVYAAMGTTPEEQQALPARSRISLSQTANVAEQRLNAGGERHKDADTLRALTQTLVGRNDVLKRGTRAWIELVRIAAAATPGAPVTLRELLAPTGLLDGNPPALDPVLLEALDAIDERTRTQGVDASVAHAWDLLAREGVADDAGALLQYENDPHRTRLSPAVEMAAADGRATINAGALVDVAYRVLVRHMVMLQLPNQDMEVVRYVSHEARRDERALRWVASAAVGYRTTETVDVAYIEYEPGQELPLNVTVTARSLEGRTLMLARKKFDVYHEVASAWERLFGDAGPVSRDGGDLPFPGQGLDRGTELDPRDPDYVELLQHILEQTRGYEWNVTDEFKWPAPPRIGRIGASRRDGDALGKNLLEPWLHAYQQYLPPSVAPGNLRRRRSAAKRPRSPLAKGQSPPAHRPRVGSPMAATPGTASRTAQLRRLAESPEAADLIALPSPDTGVTTYFLWPGSELQSLIFNDEGVALPNVISGLRKYALYAGRPRGQLTQAQSVSIGRLRRVYDVARAQPDRWMRELGPQDVVPVGAGPLLVDDLGTPQAGLFFRVNTASL